MGAVGLGRQGGADVGFLGELEETFGFGFHFLERPVAAFDVEQFGGVGTFDLQRALSEKLKDGKW
jgi:hypothetical protein